LLTFHCSYQDPFEDYKKRLANKLAKRAESEKNVVTEQEKPKDEINWFGTKVGSHSLASESGRGNSSEGVGKYLNLKRPQEGHAIPERDEVKKKRKIGFGDFSGW
jgi:peptidyl-prolyl cis-trans isomerase-like protein 2